MTLRSSRRAAAQGSPTLRASISAHGKKLKGRVNVPAGTSGELILPTHQKTNVRLDGRNVRPDKPIVLTGGASTVTLDG